MKKILLVFVVMVLTVGLFGEPIELAPDGVYETDVFDGNFYDSVTGEFDYMPGLVRVLINNADKRLGLGIDSNLNDWLEVSEITFFDFYPELSDYGWTAMAADGLDFVSFHYMIDRDVYALAIYDDSDKSFVYLFMKWIGGL